MRTSILIFSVGTALFFIIFRLEIDSSNEKKYAVLNSIARSISFVGSF